MLQRGLLLSSTLDFLLDATSNLPFNGVAMENVMHAVQLMSNSGTRMQQNML